MDTREVAQQYRLNQWIQRIRECRSSGQKIADWCAEHGFSEKTYYYWLKRVRKAACESLPALNAEKNPIVPVNIAFPAASAAQKHQDLSADIVVRLGTVSLEIHNRTTPSIIENTLRASKMFGDISKAEKIYIACGYTDMRKSINGLAALVQQNFQLNPFQNSLFLFCGHRHDRLKALYWEGDGFVLLYKRLEADKFRWPTYSEAVRNVTSQEFRMLMIEIICFWLTGGIAKLLKKQLDDTSFV